MKQLSFYIACASSLSVLAPLYYFFRNRRVWAEGITTLLGTLLLVAALSDLLSVVLSVYFKTLQNAQINVYFVLRFVIISLLFSRVCNALKTAIKITSLVYLWVFILNSIFLQHLSVLQTYAAALQDLVFIAYTFFFFHYLLKQPVAISLLRYPPFWMVTGIFFYSILSLYLFVLANYVFVHMPKEYGMALWMFHNCANILENVLFATALYYTGKKSATHYGMENKPAAVAW